MCCKKMIVFGILVVAFGVSAAIDLSGCKPSQPKIITGLQRLIGEVTSPGYNEGQNYPDNLMCQYTIIAPFGFRIMLKFLDVDIEPADMCMRDAVEVFYPRNPNVPGSQNQIVGVFCGNQTYSPIVTLGNIISIAFRSDFMVGHRGFRIRYEISGMPSVCSWGKKTCNNGNCYLPSDECNGKDDCGDGTDEEKCGFPLVASECGIRKFTGFHGFDRVIGGKAAAPGSWPWQADLQLRFIHPNGHTCGGTLINSQWIVSAAHCFNQFKDPRIWRIHLGNHHKFKKDSSEQVRYAERIILYPGITGQELLRLQQIDMMNDLALVKLSAPVKITDSVRPACVPNQGHKLPVGTKCMASGWGMTRGTGSNHVLKEVDLDIQPANVCTGQMGPIKEETMICVKNSKGFQDVCHGDSGGPLVCELNGLWNVMGATSYGTEGNFLGGLCALQASATVYSKVSHKTNWIHQQINKYS